MAVASFTRRSSQQRRPQLSKPHTMFQSCHCHGFATRQPVPANVSAKPSCDVPTVSLPRRRWYDKRACFLDCKRMAVRRTGSCRCQQQRGSRNAAHWRQQWSRSSSCGAYCTSACRGEHSQAPAVAQILHLSGVHLSSSGLSAWMVFERSPPRKCMSFVSGHPRLSTRIPPRWSTMHRTTFATETRTPI